MKQIALYDAKNRLSELCQMVSETGEPCIISRRGKPIVKIVPVEDSHPAGSVWDTVAESRQRYGALEEDFELPERSRDSRADPLEEPAP